ncbi:MAG: undecaprenyl-diphosphate phosphatase [Acidobacteriota bacterium]
MTWWHALILGLVEGITEYLPVSSTGHLIVTERLLGIAGSPAANAFAICIQSGAIAAVIGLYRGRIGAMARGLAGRDAAGRRLLVAVMAAFVPAAVLGILLAPVIERRLFGLWPVVEAWLAGGVVILVAAGRLHVGGSVRRELEALTVPGALVIGAAQCLALWPGTSRSLVTILAALTLGLSVPAAVEFSFLLGVVTLGAATVYQVAAAGPEMVASIGWVNLAIGFATATASAAAAVTWLVGYLQRHGLAAFGWYRIAVGVAVAAMISAGLVSD